MENLKIYRVASTAFILIILFCETFSSLESSRKKEKNEVRLQFSNELQATNS